jgi:hypothetical protein
MISSSNDEIISEEQWDLAIKTSLVALHYAHFPRDRPSPNFFPSWGPENGLHGLESKNCTIFQLILSEILESVKYLLSRFHHLFGKDWYWDMEHHQDSEQMQIPYRPYYSSFGWINHLDWIASNCNLECYSMIETYAMNFSSLWLSQKIPVP